MHDGLEEGLEATGIEMSTRSGGDVEVWKVTADAESCGRDVLMLVTFGCASRHPTKSLEIRR